MYDSPASVKEQENCTLRRNGGTDRGALARAAAATILYVFSVLFLSQLYYNLPLFNSIVPIQEQNKTKSIHQIFSAKVHQGDREG